MNALDRFEYVETLSKNSVTKVVYLLGKIDGDNAIVSVESLVRTNLHLDEVKKLEENDVYSWNMATLKQSLDDPTVKVNLIHPASDTHIRKYRSQKKKMVTESPQDYQRAVVPYIQRMQGKIQWVYNILDHGYEQEKVVHRKEGQEGYVLLPDMKWDGKTIESLYLVAIAMDKSLASIRDLKPCHIPFLETMKTEIIELVTRKFGIAADELKLYFHYQPSYYHLHLHVANIAHEQMDLGKSLLMDNVIDRLRFMDDGFEQATLSYFIGAEHELFSLI